ncbi:MAG: phosphoribosylamine--glycine ligase [Mycobacteriales bacterium]|nr:phosphoribosylamine--glycine ligase [Frankia sp.]
MRVLVIGSGAREHALCRALAADPAVDTLDCAPGNAGTAELAESHALDVSSPPAVAELAERLDADLTVIGPEAPLVAGAADELRRRGRPVFGPSADAAALEGSKAFAKSVMAAAGVPTAAADACADAASALAALERRSPPYVVKYDGLAAGKGVTVTDDVGVARRAVADAFAGAFGAAERVVVEDYLAGPEVSVFAVCDGEHAIALRSAQDFKRVGDADTGPNTGGMGAYSPLDWVPAELSSQITQTVLLPTLAEMRRRGAPFQGLLYAGLALTADGPQVVEFNVRFGDPETQVVVAGLQDALSYVKVGTGLRTQISPGHPAQPAAVNVVMAAPGYPGSVTTGAPIAGLETVRARTDAFVLHGGTERRDGEVVTAGGRVLSVVGLGTTVADARESAYDAVACLSFPGAHYRRDIALLAVQGEVAVPTRP